MQKIERELKVRDGPFPNPDPDFAARLLSDQYSSMFMFTQPRSKFFSGGEDSRQQHE